MSKEKQSSYPLEQSADGTNTYILPCDVYVGRRHYAVCLNIIKKQRSGDPHLWEPTCNAAIACGKCPAVDLREKEEQAGHALYYVPRQPSVHFDYKRVDIFDRGFQRGWGSIDKVNRNVPPKSAPTKADEGTSGSAHADLVNKLMKEEGNDAE